MRQHLAPIGPSHEATPEMALARAELPIDVRPRTMQPSPALMNIVELAHQLQVAKGTLYNWCYLKRIPFIKAGRCLRFDPHEVLNSLKHYKMDLTGKR